jgi:hypothetical protein
LEIWIKKINFILEKNNTILFRIVDIFVWYDETVNMSTMVPKNTFISVTRDEEYDTSIKKTTSYICGAQTV